MSLNQIISHIEADTRKCVTFLTITEIRNHLVVEAQLESPSADERARLNRQCYMQESGVL